MNKKHISDILIILISLSMLFSFGIAIFAIPQKSFSDTENRMLTKLPKLSFENITNGRYFSELGDFYSDQFPMRSIFTSTKANIERLLFKQENNDIIFGKNGYLIARGERDSATLQKNLSYLEKLSKANDVCVCVAPRGIDVLSSHLPKLCDTSLEEKANSYLESYLKERINMTDTLKSASLRGEYVWFKTDHHWTTDGAYIAYSDIAHALGITPYSINEFDRVTVSKDFLGTSASKSGSRSAEPDTITLFRYDGDDEFIVYNKEADKETNGFYDLSKLEQKDKYLVFLGGNYPELHIRAKNHDRPSLLLIKDSFANSLVPFLARHFDIDLIDPRYFKGDIYSLVKESNYEKILILIGLGTLETTHFSI